MKSVNNLYFNRNLVILLFLILFILINGGTIFAKEVTASGEAEIENGDKNVAKSIALLRAKWAAIEQVSAAKIKVDTIINNSKIMDEAIKTELTATISSYTVLEENVKDNKYYIKIKAKVADNITDDFVRNMNRDNSLCVLVAGVMPDGTVNFNNNFTLKSIELLNENGFNVADIDYNSISRKDFLNGVNYSNYNSLVKKLYGTHKCMNILLGKLSIVDKGKNTGYGTFNINIAGGELTWQLVDKNAKVLKTGSLQGRGQGVSINDAAMNVYKNMAESSSVKMVSQVAEAVLGNDKKSIRIVLTGSNTNLDDFNELRNDLKHIPFVLDIKELDSNSLVVNYPDKALYLGMFLEKDNKYKVVDLSDNELIIRK